MSREVTASVVLYKHDPQEVAPLIEALAKSEALSEWVVVDNGGSTAACALADSMGARCLEPRKNLGFGAAHNLALKQMLGKSKYHIVVNPDISLRVEVIDELYEFMEHHPDVGLVMPKIQNPDGTDQGLCKLLPAAPDLIVRRFLGRVGEFLFHDRRARYELRSVDLTVPCEVPCLSGCFMFMRSAVLRKVGLFDERFFMYMEDVDLCRRIGVISKCVYYPSVFVTHGYAKGSYRDLRLLRNHARSALQYFSKWGWLSDAERKRLNERAGKKVKCANDRSMRPIH